MHGNVWEWVQDRWQRDYYEQFRNDPAVDPIGAASGIERVIRGGDWNNPSFFSRASLRYARELHTDNFPVGFRVALSVEAVRKAFDK